MTVILVALGADYVKVVEDRPIQFATEKYTKQSSFSDISFMAIFAEITENERIIDKHLRDVHPCLLYTSPSPRDS